MGPAHGENPVRQPGLEPGSQPWEGCILPLDYWRGCLQQMSRLICHTFLIAGYSPENEVCVLHEVLAWPGWITSTKQVTYLHIGHAPR